MTLVYFNQNGVWVYAGRVQKEYEVGDVFQLKRVHYPLRVVQIDDNDRRQGRVIYCELVCTNAL